MALPSGWKPALDGWSRTGGQGNVYAVHRAGSEKVYALKRLVNTNRAARFETEIAAMRQLADADPPIVPTVVDSGVDDRGHSFYVMPFYEQGSLEDSIRQQRYADDIAEALSVLVRVADLISRAHDAGWAHRDLKPANVLITDDGYPLLGDFRLALLAATDGPRVTDTNEAVGSRLYIAPENESGVNPAGDQRPTDCYAFAKICYAVIAGRNPPARERQLEATLHLSAVLHTTALEGIDLLCDALLRVDPQRRLVDWSRIIAGLSAARTLLTEPPQTRADPRDLVAEATDEAARYVRSASVATRHCDRPAQPLTAQRLGDEASLIT
jgi:serine/threonine protein kinase